MPAGAIRAARRPAGRIRCGEVAANFSGVAATKVLAACFAIARLIAASSQARSKIMCRGVYFRLEDVPTCAVTTMA